MSVVGQNILAGASGAGDYTIDQSLRFNSGDSPQLTRTPTSVGNRQIYTISAWAKVCDEKIALLEAFTDTNNLTAFYVDVASFRIYGRDSGDDIYWNSAGGGYLTRDPAAWYHFCIAVDLTESSASDMIKVWVNNELMINWGTQTGPPASYSSDINNTIQHHIGSVRQNTGTRVYPEQYLAEYHLIDGQALTPSSFAEANEDTNKWTAIKYAGTYGTNGFYLKFEDSADLGNDSSGNGNDYTSTNLAATDQVPDSPTNNFSTWNPLASNPSYTFSLSEGNLKNTNTAGSYRTTINTIGMTSGKWYFESYINRLTSWVQTGIIGIDSLTDTSGLVATYIGSKSKGYGYNSGDGKVYNADDGGSAYGNTYTADDIIGIAVDLDNSKLYFSKNGTWQNSGVPTSGATGTGAYSIPAQNSYYFGQGPYNGDMTGNWGQDSSFAGAKTAQGNADGNGIGDFYYSPPSGYLALCTSNLSDPSIALPGENFNTVLYTADASSGNAVTGVGFQPDFVWVKDRDYTEHHALQDAIRGSTCVLASDVTNAQACHSTYMESFDSDGFTVGSDGWLNRGTDSYVAWNWLAADTFDPKTDGDIAVASGRRNATAGFSIVKYTGENAVKTIGHGLATAPKFIIVKALVSHQWECYYLRSDNSDGVLFLDQNGAGEAAGSGYWNDTNPTASVFTVGTGSGTGGLTSDYISYCFSEVEGYSKIGWYTGNGNADGAFVYTGFRPAWAMIKRLDSTGSWSIRDSVRAPYNVILPRLWADLNNAESTSSTEILDFTSNGIKTRADIGGINTSGGTYMYLAFAESPFKYSNAR